MTSFWTNVLSSFIGQAIVFVFYHAFINSNLDDALIKRITPLFNNVLRFLNKYKILPRTLLCKLGFHESVAFGGGLYRCHRCGKYEAINGRKNKR